MRFPSSNELFYFGGPASLINGACEEHANCKFRLGRLPPANGAGRVWLTDEADCCELTAVYGDEARCDFQCVQCGQPLASPPAIDIPHMPPLHGFLRSSAQPTTRDYVAALDKEIEFVQDEIDNLKVKVSTLLR